MATTLLDVLATLPSGAIPRPMNWDELSLYLKTFYFTHAETLRESRHILRDKLYRDGGVEEMCKLIDAVYTNPIVREKRKAWAKWTRYDNITKKVVNESSTVYREPALRTVKGEENNARYQMALAKLDIHRKSKRWNKMLNLHRALLVGVRVFMDGTDESTRRAKIEIVTPANCRLITHPNDCHHIVAVAVRMRVKTQGDYKVPEQLRGQLGVVTDRPEWQVWSDSETFMMRSDWTILGDTIRAHTLGRIPYVFVALDEPADDTPWPGECGQDLVAADMASWFTAVNELKEVKSATRQQIVSGNLDAAQRAQAADSEMPIELPDDVALTSQDMSMDVSIFRDTRAGIKDDVGNNYGLASQIMRNQGTQSAEARENMRIPLREQRIDQISVLKVFERDLAECASVVLQKDWGQIAFTTDGWEMQFQDPQTPLTGKEELERFEQERGLGLNSGINYVMERNPDMTREQARAFLMANIEDELWRNKAMRPLQVISGSMGAEQPTGTTDLPRGVNNRRQGEEPPEERGNGQNGQKQGVAQ